MRGIRAARDEPHAVTLDDPRVVAGPELVSTRTLREFHEGVEAKRAVAAHARIRRLPAGVRLRERVDDRALELFAQIERHVRKPERVTGGARCGHRSRGAAGTLGVRGGGVLPQPQRHADCLSSRPVQRDRAVHTAAHRDHDPPGARPRSEHRPERGCECVDGQRLAADRCRLDQREPVELPLEPRRVGRDDRVAVDRQPSRRPGVAARRVSENLGPHRR